MSVSRVSFSSIAAAAILVTAACASPQSPSEKVAYSNPYDSPQQFMEGMYAADARIDPPSSPRIRAVVVPHHLTATESIASGIKMLDKQDIKHIVLLSPDHFHRCPVTACTVDGSFETLFGTVKASTSNVEALLGSPLFRANAELFRQEHGVHAVLPYIARLKPGVDVTSVVLSQRLPWRTQKEELLSVLEEIVDDDTVVVVSSDFSHYLPLFEAERLDEETAEILFSGNLEGIASLQNPGQSDCPSCLWLVAALAQERSFYKPSTILHTNAATLLGDTSAAETTSHFSMAWYENTKLSPADTAFAGDVTVTRGDAPPLAPDLAAFWSGSGARVVNLEGPLRQTCAAATHAFDFCNPLDRFRAIKALATHWSVMNNHLLDQGTDGVRVTADLLKSLGEIPLTTESVDVGGLKIFALTNVLNPVPAVGSIDVAGEYDRVLKRISESKNEKPIVVFVHAGEEYAALLSDADRTYLRSFIDAGADAVIAVHSHVPSDMEMYRGKPIFHGLGNFVFDQYDKTATRTAKVVRLRHQGEGVVFETGVFRDR